MYSLVNFWQDRYLGGLLVGFIKNKNVEFWSKNGFKKHHMRQNGSAIVWKLNISV